MDETTALVPAKPARIRRRDKFGLQLNQKRALLALAEGATWEVAAEAAKVAVSTLRGWTQTDTAFITEYQSLLTGLLGEFKGRMTTLLPRVGDALVDALDANKPLEVEAFVKCPECEHTFPAKMVVEVPNYGVRLRVAEDLMKQHGQLGQTLKVEGEIAHKHTLELSTDDRIAIQRIRRFGRDSVPSDIVESLQQRGVIEGEYREIPLPDDTSAESGA